MAQVTSSKDMTVIVLDNDEASALADLLHENLPEHADDTVLDELINGMLGNEYAMYDEEDEGIRPVTNWDRPEPPWKDEPSSDYRCRD